jgi:hypothetical protein
MKNDTPTQDEALKAEADGWTIESHGNKGIQVVAYCNSTVYFDEETLEALEAFKRLLVRRGLLKGELT